MLYKLFEFEYDYFMTLELILHQRAMYMMQKRNKLHLNKLIPMGKLSIWPQIFIAINWFRIERWKNFLEPKYR